MPKRINLNKILTRQAEREQKRKELRRRIKKKGLQPWVKKGKAK